MTRKKRVSLDTKLIIYGLSANVIVKQAPALVNKFITIPDTLSTFVGAGVGAAAGYVMGSNELFNLSLAAGGAVYANQIINSVMGNPTTILTSLVSSKPVVMGVPTKMQSEALADYYRLNGYEKTPYVNKNYFSQYAYN